MLELYYSRNKFKVLLSQRDWDGAQALINEACEKYPEDEELNKLKAEFATQRSAYDTSLIESAPASAVAA